MTQKLSEFKEFFCENCSFRFQSTDYCSICLHCGAECPEMYPNHVRDEILREVEALEDPED